MPRKPADQSVNKEDILIAAAQVLRENGYDGTTMKDIAAKVNLTAASLYHHFKSKDFLLLAVLEIGLEYAIKDMEKIIEEDVSNLEKLKEMIRTHITSITSNTAVGAAMVFEIRSLINVKLTSRKGKPNKSQTEFINRRDHFFNRRDYFESLLRSVVKDGIQSGEFRATDPAIITKAMLGAHNWVGVWYRDAGRLSGDQVADIMIDFFIQSLTCART
ncbi:TetR/AcrR family transcriptional regulator [Anaerolineales bacterium]